MPSSLLTVLCELDHGVAQVTLNRPDVLNAFNEAMQEEVQAAWHWARQDDAVRAVIVTGAGEKAFCAGIDRNDIPVHSEQSRRR